MRSKSLGLLFVFLTAIRALSQDVLAPPPLEYLQPPPAVRPLGTDQPIAPPLIGTPAEKPLQWGPVEFHPHMLYQFIYGDGVPTRPGEREKTAINGISPGLLFSLGERWRLDYTPTFRFYSNDEFRDTVDHAIALDGGTAFQDWVLNLSQRCLLTSDPLTETGRQTDQENYVTAFNAAWSLSSKISLELGLSQNLRFVDQGDSTEPLSDSKDWSTMNWLNYQFWPYFGAAIGIGAGYVDVGTGSDMTYEQIQARINWRAGQKLSLVVSGGVEDRQLLDSNVDDLVNPLFSLAMVYQIFEPTTISLNGSHVVSPSYFQDQVTESSSIGGSIRQRLLEKFYLDVAAGYTFTTYETTVAGIPVDREDDYVFFNVRLTFAFLKRGTASVFYRLSDNTSNEDEFGYSSDQVGFELGYRY